MEKRYELNGKTWILRPLVLGQWKALQQVLKRTSIPAGVDIPGLIFALQDVIPIILAIILIEDGKGLDDRFSFRVSEANIPEWHENPERLSEIASEIAVTIDADTTLQIATDFFQFCDLASLLNNIARTFNTITERMNDLTRIGSSDSSSSSAEAT